MSQELSTGQKPNIAIGNLKHRPPESGIPSPEIQLEAEVFNPPDVFPLIPIVNKSCNIERCVNNMLQIIRNMMVSQWSELELSMFGGTTLSSQHPLIYVWVQN